MAEKLLLVRFRHPHSGLRVGLMQGQTLYDIGGQFVSIAAWLQSSVGRVEAAVEGLARLVEKSPQVEGGVLLAPADDQDVWAAGVTYERSREARQEEAVDGGDVYARVYSAERPEIFFKAQGRNAVGTGGAVGIRADSAWNVPEPELTIVFNPAMEVVGFTVGNDMSSRDIEGENPLYLPQAKVYNASCGLGPGILLAPSNDWPDASIRLSIQRNGAEVFSGDVHTARLKRRIPELADYLGRSNSFPSGVMLMTGTGIVPPSDFTLAVDDVVTISIDGIGSLTNTIIQV